MDRGSFQAGLDELGAFESGRPSGDPEQYRIQNTLGFTGKYQFGEALLIDLGFYEADTFFGNGAATNEWRGNWTSKAQSFGVNSIEDFRNSPDIQEAAIRDAFEANFETIETVLNGSGQTIGDFLGETLTFDDGGQQRSVEITEFGILAGAHLRGAFGLSSLLLDGQVSRDEFGTSIVQYVEDYAGFDVPDEITGGIGVASSFAGNEITVDEPAIAQDDVAQEEITGEDVFANEPTVDEPTIDEIVIPQADTNSDFTDSLTGTDGVANSFNITEESGRVSLIENFNAAEDSINLGEFSFDNRDDYSLGTDSNGNAVIDIVATDQTIVLDGVSQSDLLAERNILI